MKVYIVHAVGQGGPSPLLLERLFVYLSIFIAGCDVTGFIIFQYLPLSIDVACSP